MPSRLKKLFVFDFDDTLATTPSLIGVRRLTLNREHDPTFQDWIYDLDLDITEIENENTPQEIIWFDSKTFAEYERAHQRDLDHLDSAGVKDEYDFSKTAGIDLENTQPLESIVGLAREASSDPEAMVIVITARASEKTIYSLQGDIAPSSNIEDISQYLNSQGIAVSNSDINTVGDIEGGGGGAKVQALQTYIDRYDPEYIFFYDDNQNNIAAIASLCKDNYPHIKIKTFKIGDGGSIENVGGCYETYSRFLY